MDQTAVQQVVANVNPQSLRGILGLLGGQGQGGDAFAMIFEQLMGQMDGEGLGGLGELAGLFGQAGESDDSDQKDANELAMQMMAELFFTAQPQVQELLAEEQSLVSEATSQNQSIGLSPEQLLKAAAEQLSQRAGEKEQGEEEKPTPISFQQVSAEAKEEKTWAPLNSQLEFQNAVREAKEALSAKPKEEVKAPDIESLQQDVSTNRFLPSTVSGVKDLSEPDANSVVEQLKTGILDNRAKGKNEFIVRLKPDGMGEITVKMVEDKSKITLSIVASSPSVAKMLTNEVMTLQNALRPLHAEVSEIVTSAEGAAHTAAEHGGFANQEFAGQQQFSGQEQGHARHTGGKSGEFGSIVEESKQEPDAELNIYI